MTAVDEVLPDSVASISIGAAMSTLSCSMLTTRSL
jgi:hypothetical protein